MAGNIIHAIATTNAIVGGLIVIEALKLLAGAPEHSKVCPSVEQMLHERSALCLAISASIEKAEIGFNPVLGLVDVRHNEDVIAHVLSSWFLPMTEYAMRRRPSS
jgi:hypothetical protein